MSADNWRNMMKKILAVTLFVLTLAVGLTGAAFASDAVQKAKLTVSDAVSVGGTVLAPGTYNVTITRTGSDATVVFAKGKKTVATASGSYTAVSKFGYDLAVVSTGSSATALEGDKLKGSVRFTPAAEGAVAAN
jgi:hypothetical protein